VNVHPEAHALSAFRVLKNGEPRQYTATTFPRDPWRGCEHMIRMAKAIGCLDEESGDGYAVLDVLNENGDIVQDYSIPDARAWEWIKRKLNFAVERSDDECPAEHRGTEG
jgi:hypothetical protein